MKGILLIATALLTIASCTHPADSGDFSAQELALIKNAMEHLPQKIMTIPGFRTEGFEC